jgi:hypothetical protein
MRFSKRHIEMASVILASTLALGQQPQINGREINGPSSLLVRLSFTSTWVADVGDKDFPQICFSVDRSGRYQMRRLTKQGNADFLEGTLHPELLQGTLLPNELTMLENFLQDPEFRGLAGSSGSILRKGAETFVAEVPRANSVRRVVMSDADRENPFPRSVDQIVRWLQRFKAEGAKPLDVSAQDICPSGALQPVNPATALLQPTSSSSACIMR